MAASWAAGRIRDVLGMHADVHILLTDSRGELRAVSTDDGRAGQRWSALPAIGREAFESGTPRYIDRSADPDLALGFFPLVSAERALGLIEIAAPDGSLRARSDAISVVADRLAGWLAELSHRERFRQRIGSLERDAALMSELLRAGAPEVALWIAAESLGRGCGVPVCVWWSEHQGPLSLSAASGVTDDHQRALREQMGTIPAWASLTARNRATLRRRFRSLVGARQVTARDVCGAVLMVGSGEPDVRRRVRTLGSHLEEVLPLLAASARERRRDDEINLGLAWTAHEVRGPLLGVRAALELLARRARSGDSGLLERTLREVDRLVEDTDDVLGWAIGSRPLSLRYVDVVEVVRAAVEPLGSSPDHAVDVVASGPVVAAVDPTHLRMAVANLVRNAVAYSKPGSAVVVQIDHEGSTLDLCVRDEGPGVPATERESIFDPFVRGEAGSRGGQGSGLGLFITRRVVEAHGGKVWVDAGRPGAAFHVRLPVEGKELQRFAS